ncbi:EAL domain-containing protein [Sulfurimonas sp. MAG313]|nr:EAL domain-containing protein [Sulfurimonas sp. MAG313]MDF1882046.1 EAL domain-containing protein [Sulfurimonas sp. MAG313]
MNKDKLIELDVESELIKLSYSNLPFALIASLVVALIFTLVLFSQCSSLWMGIWFGSFILLSVFRYADARQYKADIYRYSPKQWKQRFYIGLLAMTALWGIFTILFFPAHDILLQAFIIILMAGLSAGATNSLASYKLFFISFITLFLLPLVGVLLVHGGMLYLLLALSIVLYILMMSAISLSIHKNILHLIENNKRYKKIQNDLQRSEDRVVNIFQHVPIGIFSFDTNKRIIECNQGLSDIVQAPIKSLKGLDLNLLKDKKIFSVVKDVLLGEEVSYEGPYTTLLSELSLWISVRITPLYDDAGKVEGGLAVLTDMTEKKKQEEEIEFLAFHDTLTHLPNRAVLHNRLEHFLLKRKYDHQHGALLFIDMDHFKTINDSLGHHIGDEVLREFSVRVGEFIRKEDTFSRLGGDEFILLLFDLSVDTLEAISQIHHITDKIHASTKKDFMIQEHTLHISVSIGVTLITEKENNRNDLLKHADLAMYKAKQEGRNRTCFYEEEMDEEVKKRLSLENDLHKAISNNELEVYYQPIVEMQTHKVVCAEALLRFCKQDGNIIYPDDFIPVAEENGMIVPIGYWVIEEVCRHYNSWREKGILKDLKNIAINISPKQFMQEDFIQRIVSIIQLYGIAYDVFELEITESVVICDVEKAIEKMKKLKDLGFILSMDDFGTGYSSLSYLKNLPFDIIKIDKSFIQNILTNEDDKTLVDTILSICDTYKLEVIAEGIEEEEQIKYLSQTSCTYYQGYILSRPIPSKEFEKFLG